MLNMFNRSTNDKKVGVKNLMPVQAADSPKTRVKETKARKPTVDIVDLKVRMHRRLLETMNLAALDKMAPEQARSEISQMVRELLPEEKAPLNSSEMNQLSLEIVDEVFGLGPLEPLIKDTTVSDILVNTHGRVFVARAGKLEETEVRF